HARQSAGGCSLRSRDPSLPQRLRALPIRPQHAAPLLPACSRDLRSACNPASRRRQFPVLYSTCPPASTASACDRFEKASPPRPQETELFLPCESHTEFRAKPPGARGSLRKEFLPSRRRPNL